MRWCFSLRPDEGKHRLLEGSTAKQIMIRRAAGFILFAALALGGAYAQDHAPAEPEAYRTDNYRAPTPKTLRGARTVTTRRSRSPLENGNRGFRRCDAACPAPGQSSRRNALARKAAIEYSREHLVAGHGLRRALRGHGRIPASRIGADHRWRSRKAPGDLLSEGLLDVVERRQAGRCVGLQRRRLVPRRHRRLARRWTSTRAGTTGAASRRVRMIHAIAGSCGRCGRSPRYARLCRVGQRRGNQLVAAVSTLCRAPCPRGRACGGDGHAWALRRIERRVGTRALQRAHVLQS